MNVVEQYLNEILGISVRLKPVPEREQTALPFFLKHLYTFKKGKLFGREIIFLEEKNDEHLTAAQLRKHSEIVEMAFNRPVVFILPAIESYNRKRLIQKQVAFVIPGKQLFIPQLLIDLREFQQTASKQREKFLPAAQCLFFYHLLKENLEPLNFKTIARKLGYTQMTVTRAAKVLERNGIATIKGTKEKYIVFGTDKKKLWEKALPLLQTPVKKVYFLEQPPQTNVVYRASFSALAHYTNLAEGNKKYFAVSQNDFGTLKMKKQIQVVPSSEADVHLEVWKYAPGVLTKDRVVDPLSLFLSLKNQEDERVQKALDALLEQVW
ncbi:MAG: MarR family transcriptional regulator [Calditrichaeota bacterium]|nr:MarR family transcriptional regulator [Calditrichota bacterium]